MGLDAESSDLTARIQARRRALVLAGEVDPSLPGERVIHGRQPGAYDSFETTGAAQVIAHEARARRSRAAETVVEMDYTDYRGGAGPVSEDADEPFDVGADEGDDPENTWVPDEDEVQRVEEVFALAAEDSMIELRLAGVEEGLACLEAASEERSDALAAGFLALAKGLSEELATILTHIEAHRLNTEVEPEPPRPSWWRRFFSALGRASGPYE